MNAWVLLSIAIVIEVFATAMLKMSDGLVKWQWAAGAIAAYCVCFLFMAPAYKTIPLGVAYAVWSGAGIAILTVFGMIYFEENVSWTQLFFIGMITVGAVGLNLTTYAADKAA